MGDPRAAQVLAFSKQGMSDPEIGKKMGLHKVTVWKLRKWGSTASFRPGSKTKAATSHAGKGVKAWPKPTFKALPPVAKKQVLKAPVVHAKVQKKAPIGLSVETKRVLAEKLYKEGLNDRQIGLKLGVSRQRVWKLRHWGADKKPAKATAKATPKPMNRAPGERLMAIRKLHREGVSDGEIGKKFGLSRNTVWKLRHWGKSSRPKGKSKVKVQKVLTVPQAMAAKVVQDVLETNPEGMDVVEFNADIFRSNVRGWLKDLIVKEFDSIKAAVVESLEFDLA